MAKIKISAEFEIEVGGETYIWSLHRRPKWVSDPAERLGMAVMVRHAEGQREAVLEFPIVKPPRFGAPQLQASQIPVRIVANAIASAIAAGWEPLSRGKTVQILVDEAGN